MTPAPVPASLPGLSLSVRVAVELSLSAGVVLSYYNGNEQRFGPAQNSLESVWINA
jgi:hypothetical protein